MGSTISRRVFFTACGGAALAAAVPATMRGTMTAPALGSTEALTLERFESLLGQSFTVSPESGAAPIRVVLSAAARCRDGFTRDQDGRAVMESFSLEFAGVPVEDAVSGVHTLHHPAIGEHAFLMTPVADDTDAHRRYEVIMTRMVQA